MDRWGEKTLTEENEELKKKIKDLEEKLKKDDEDDPFGDGGSKRHGTKRDDKDWGGW